mmetsp:Transcript_11672/g.26581  ORF Transcript_11672/g.26581 Transcript_11672/m.26581 type:complete len:253 (-) Transcript_11672:106-864(-)
MEKLQEEIRSIKAKFGTSCKLSKGEKGSPTFPFPIGVQVSVERPEAAKMWDESVDEITMKLVIGGLEVEDLSVVAATVGFPKTVAEAIAEATTNEWRSKIKKGGAEKWRMDAMLKWVETNFDKLMRLVPAAVSTYEGVDASGASCRKCTLIEPTATTEVVVEEEISEEEQQRRMEEFVRREAERLVREEAEREAEAEEKRKLALAGMGEYKAPQLSKKELAALNPSRKEQAGHRMRKTAPRSSKATADEKKK